MMRSLLVATTAGLLMLSLGGCPTTIVPTESGSPAPTTDTSDTTPENTTPDNSTPDDTTTPADDETPTETDDTNDDDLIDARMHTLFVVSNGGGSSITSYPATDVLGSTAPTHELPAGAATGLFQARSVLVTDKGMLIATRQNGGIIIYEHFEDADGATPADRVVDGKASLLDTPISLAYDEATDTLYVGTANAEEGILAFNNVSLPAFNGDVAPNRTFATEDRVPFQGSIEMTIDALWFDNRGVLYASDTSGLNVNSSRILVWDDPSNANGETPASRTITSPSLGQIEDLVVDDDGNLFVVDSAADVLVFANGRKLNGDVQPSAMITVNTNPTPQFDGIAIDSDGTGYLADRSNSAIHTIADLFDQSGPTGVTTTLTGFETGLIAPRQIWLLEETE